MVDLLAEIEQDQPSGQTDLLSEAGVQPQRQPTQQEIQQELLRKQASEVGPVESFLIGTGRGLTTIGRAIGLADPEPPLVTQAIEELGEQRPITSTAGEIVGEVAPFVVPGLGIGSIPARAGQIAAGVGLGGAEGALIAKGKGGDAGQILTSAALGASIGGTAEALLPVIGRLGDAVVRKVTGRSPQGALVTPQGTPTPELQDALSRSGLTFDDLTNQAQASIRQQPAGTEAQQAVRAVQFEQIGAPATRGDITQEFAQQAEEARLFEAGADPRGDPIRSLRLQQSQAFERQLNEAISESGVSDEVGESVKAALTGRETLLREEKNRLYKEFAETSPEIRNTPILVDNIVEAAPSESQFRRISRLTGTQVPAVRELMVEFGIDRSPQAIDDFLKGGNQITPLNVGNFDEFRSALNQIERSDTTGATSTLTGPIKRALDEEAGIIDDSIRAAGITDESVLAPLKEARKTVRQIKTEFSPQSVAGRLTQAKRDGITPVVESSRVFKEVLGPNVPPERLTRTLESLRNAGPKGKKAIGDLQARTVMELIDSAFAAKGRKVAGESLFDATAYTKKLDQIGKDRLEDLFKGNKKALDIIMNVEAVAKNIIPPSGALPKGSASVIIDVLDRSGLSSVLQRIPGGGSILVDLIKTSAQSAGNRKALDRALDARPNVKKMAGVLEKQLPGLATTLGVSGALQEE